MPGGAGRLAGLRRAARYVDIRQRASLCLLVPAIVLGLFWLLAGVDRPHDFQAFVDSGRAAAAGTDPYGVYTVVFDVPFPNLNPPVSVVLFRVLADVEPTTALRVWLLASVVLYAATVALVLRDHPAQATLPHVAWLLALGGLWNTLESKNVYALLALLSVGAWWCLRRDRRVAAGLLIGLLTAIRPNLAVWPLLLLLAGHWTVAGTALATAAGLSALPVAVYGPAIYLEWLAAVQQYAFPIFPHNASLTGLAARWRLLWLGPVASAGLLLGLVVWVRRRRRGLLEVSGPAVVGALLAAPLAWVAYTLLLVPIFFGRAWGRTLGVAAALLVLPPPYVSQWAKSSPLLLATVGAVYPVALILVLTALVHEPPVPQVQVAERALEGATP